MKVVTTVCVAVIASVLTGCTREVNKLPVPTSGSRADGTVDLTYDFYANEKPVINWATAQASAEERCHVWGYTGADRFGGERHACLQMTNYGCMSMQVTVTYQCTGGKPVIQSQ